MPDQSIPEQVDAYLASQRQKYELPDYYWDERRERMVAERTLAALREEIARLVGYHQRDGAVPIEKVEALLDDARKDGA